MTGAIRVVLEVGPKGKRVVAVAPDWPGLVRGAKTEEAGLSPEQHGHWLSTMRAAVAAEAAAIAKEA